MAALLLGIAWGVGMALFTGWGRREQKLIWVLSGLLLFGPWVSYVLRRQVSRWDAEHIG